MVRPWNECSSATTCVRGAPCGDQYRRANFRQASTASVPLLQKNARGSPDSAASLAASFRLQRMEVQVRRVQQLRGLRGDRRDQARVRVAERRDADARDEVEVAAAGARRTGGSRCRARRRPARAGRSAARGRSRAPSLHRQSVVVIVVDRHCSRHCPTRGPAGFGCCGELWCRVPPHRSPRRRVPRTIATSPTPPVEACAAGRQLGHHARVRRARRRQCVDVGPG